MQGELVYEPMPLLVTCGVEHLYLVNALDAECFILTNASAYVRYV